MDESRRDDSNDEAAFMDLLEANPLPLPRLTACIQRTADTGRRADADAMAKLLQDTLAEQERTGEALDVLRWRVDGMENLASARKAIREEASEILGSERRRRALLDHVGLDGAVTPSESVRRLRLLCDLGKGALCYDRTWGFGVVRSVDDFDLRIEIDFETKAGHRMTFAYAAETLEHLKEDHLLARRHRDPEGMARCIQKHPAQVVKWTLQSFGPLPVAILQERLSPRMVTPDDWKRFWDAARKELKRDPLVHLPARRTEPIELRDRAEDFGEAWLRQLAAERDMATVLKRVEAWIENKASAPAAPEAAQAVVERLAFVVKGAGERQPGLVAQAAMLAETAGIESEALDVAALAARLTDPERLAAAASALSVKQRRAFFEFMHRRIGDDLPDALLSLLPVLDMATFAEAVSILLQAGHEDACAQIIRDLITTPERAPEAMLWLVRNPAYLTTWGPASTFDRARLILGALEFEHTGDRLKAQNALRDRIGRADALGEIFDALTPAQRRELLLRLRETPAWPQLERQALVGLMVKRFPELEAALSRAVAPDASGRTATTPAAITSERSYNERQRQLHRLITEEIPRNSREIGVARSYGDLRENFEYKAAKEMQTILLSRRAEWERHLDEVRPTDFEGYSADRAGPGTGVTVEHADGTRETFYLLGLWDQDETLGIVSSDAQLAKALHGHTPGERVHLPGAAETAPATIVEVVPLPTPIRDWVRGGEPGP